MKITISKSCFDKYNFDIDKLISWIKKNHDINISDISDETGCDCSFTEDIVRPTKTNEHYICLIVNRSFNCRTCIFNKKNIEDIKKLIKYIKEQ